MTRTHRLRRTVGVALAGLLLLTACEFDGAYDLPLPGSPVDEDDSYEVTAEFADILNVVPRSPVMVDDVTVGEVTEVDRDGWHARITMRVREDVELPANVIADIRQVSLLGEKYVALEPPEDVAPEGVLSDGDNIPIEATGRNPEVEEVLGALSFLLSGGGVAQLGTITQELNNVMSGRTNRLRSLLGTLENVVGTLDDQKADIVRALESMNNLTATLNAERDTITSALDATGPAIEVLADQHDELVDMLGALDRLGVVGTRVIRASKDNLLRSLRDLRPVLDKLSDAGPKLAPGLNLIVSFPFPQEASEVVQGDYANTSIRMEVSLDNLFTGLGIPETDLSGLMGNNPVAPALDSVTRCLRSGSLTSKACRAVLGSGSLLRQLVATCREPAYRRNVVCRALGTLSGGGGLLDGLSGGLPGLNRLTTELSSGAPSPAPSGASLYGGQS
ncbi:MAG: MCE family protein [Actinomycetota bacterium]|nr:MCE family protein [Actinomycetota bacterium]